MHRTGRQKKKKKIDKLCDSSVLPANEFNLLLKTYKIENENQ